MPQFDIANFVPQLAWLTLFFAILYFGIVRATLPKVAGVVDRRSAMVDSDISTAEAAKAEADRIRQTYESAMTDARATALASTADAKAAGAKAMEAQLAAANAALDEKAAAAEASLEAARGSAMAEIERIATEAAADIVALVAGTRPDDEAARNAVRGARAA